MERTPKKAEDLGWYLHKHGANHDMYRHTERNDILVLGRHRKEEVKTGTYNKIKKQIGL